MTRKLLVAALLAMFIVALTGSAFAWSGRADAEGKPDRFAAAGYYIWHDEHGFHIWMAPDEQGRVFSGVIRTDGQFLHVRGHRLEGGDSYRTYSDVRDKSWFDVRTISGNRFAYGNREVNCDKQKLRFKFNTAGGADGLNFSVRDANYVEFDLYLDGRPALRRYINLGDEGWHPEDHTFRIFP